MEPRGGCAAAGGILRCRVTAVHMGEGTPRRWIPGWVVVFDLLGNLTASFGLNYFHFGNSCRGGGEMRPQATGDRSQAALQRSRRNAHDSRILATFAAMVASNSLAWALRVSSSEWSCSSLALKSSSLTSSPGATPT